MNAKNDDDNTVLDLLVDLPSERSQEITALIYGKFYFYLLRFRFLAAAISGEIVLLNPNLKDVRYEV